MIKGKLILPSFHIYLCKHFLYAFLHFPFITWPARIFSVSYISSLTSLLRMTMEIKHSNCCKDDSKSRMTSAGFHDDQLNKVLKYD
jgi:hypothetical protein